MYSLSCAPRGFCGRAASGASLRSARSRHRPLSALSRYACRSPCVRLLLCASPLSTGSLRSPPFASLAPLPLPPAALPLGCRLGGWCPNSATRLRALPSALPRLALSLRSLRIFLWCSLRSRLVCRRPWGLLSAASWPPCAMRVSWPWRPAVHAGRPALSCTFLAVVFMHSAQRRFAPWHHSGRAASPRGLAHVGGGLVEVI